MWIQEAPLHPAAPRAPAHRDANALPIIPLPWLHKGTLPLLSLCHGIRPRAGGFAPGTHPTALGGRFPAAGEVGGGQDLFSGGSSQP